ncbi:MAG TPA: diguanylate cyclase [Anaerovoracaceae bacterium]|nr:diguanylate cyclase [Anaerovoracaceae bacterium]
MRRAMIVVVVLLALIPAILIGCSVNYYAQATNKTEKQYALAGIAEMMEDHINKYYIRLISDIQAKADEYELRIMLETQAGSGDLAPDDLTKAQKVLLESIKYPIIGGSVINTEGEVVLSSRPLEKGLMLDQTELYNSIMKGNDSYAGLVVDGNITDLAEIAVPIHNGQGKVVGIFKQNAEIDVLNEYLGSLSIGKSGYAFLVRKSGHIIFDKSKAKPVILYHEYQNNNSLEQLVTDFKTDELKEDKGIIEFYNKGVEYVGAYEKIDSINSIAVVAMNRNELYENGMSVKAILAAVAGLVFAIIAACGFIIGHLYNAPFIMMSDTLRKIVNGDMSARCKYNGKNEFEELCRNINSLADRYQKNERALRISSRIDNLTHLPNRIAIYEVLDTLLYKHPNQAILLLDLDGFKSVNDNLGYETGDRILMEIGDILRELPQHVCYPSRLGGAEFLVFVTNWTAPKYPEMIAQKIIKKIEGIRFVDEVHIDLGASIGIEYTEDEKIDKMKLIKHCNIALHKARLIGKNSYFVHYQYMKKE